MLPWRASNLDGWVASRWRASQPGCPISRLLRESGISASSSREAEVLAVQCSFVTEQPRIMRVERVSAKSPTSRKEREKWANRRAGGCQWGAGWVLSGGVGGGVDVLSSLNTTAILPKKPFFFLGSGVSCALTGCVGGVSGLSLPRMREKKPAMPFCRSQVSRGSVPATNADT